MFPRTLPFPAFATSRATAFLSRRLCQALASLGLVVGPALAAAAVGQHRAVTIVHEAGATGIRDDVRAVVQIGDGTVVVGSNSLAAYDGSTWRPIQVPNAYAFRALATGTASTPTRVWFGAIGEIGYVERGADGNWQHTSLMAEVAAAGLNLIDDVWSVRALAEGAVWVTDEHVLRWNPSLDHRDRMRIWRLPGRSRLAAFGGSTAVWIYQEGVGLLRLESDGEPILALADATLPEKPVTWMLPSNETRSTALLGLNDGAYRWPAETRTLQRMDQLSDVLKSQLPTDAAGLPGGRIAVATFKAGVVIASADGRILDRYSTAEGLSGNSVYALWARGHRLWAATPEGLTRIDGVGTTRLFDRQHALDGGRPLAVLRHEQETFLITTRSVWRDPPPVPESVRPWNEEPIAQGVFNDAAIIAGDLWISGIGGLWRIADGQAYQEHFAANDVTRLCTSRRHPDSILFLEGYQLKLLMPSTRSGWIARDLGVSVNDSPISLIEDVDGDVWVSTMKDGVTRFGWHDNATSDAPRLQRGQTYRNGAGLQANAGRVELVPLGERMYAFTDAGILVLRADKRLFEPASDFTSYEGISASQMHGNDVIAHWLVRSKSLTTADALGVIRIDASGDRFSVEELAVPGIDGAGSLTTIAHTGDSLWLGSNRGLLQVVDSSLRPTSPPPAPPLIVIHDPEKPESIDFRFGLAEVASGESYFYQSRLADSEAEWTPPSPVSHRTFDGLGPASYRFEVRSLDRFGRAGSMATHAFAVFAPWWKTAPAFASYGIFAVLIVAGIARWQVLRLRRQNERLDRLVQERTREIELVSTAKSEFLDNVSHEIRNPLNGLTGLLALLKEDRLDAREKQLARSLKSVAATLTQVFEDVLQFSKLEYGYGRLNRRPFALKPLLEEIVTLFSVPAEQAGCTLVLNWPAPLADGFEGDPEKIKTIVVNYVGNALKYAPGAPVEIRVEATAETDGMVDLYLDVIDHGPGVPSAEQELIFKKFVRGRRAGAGEVPGTGLGLATCRMLAKLMNGSVGVESSPGQGATFYLKLFLARAEIVKQSNSDINGVTQSGVSSHRMLIVDDESYNRVVLEGIALELGATSDSAGSVAEALQRLSAANYSVVLLDWELPDANGGEVARALHALKSGHRPVVLATTAHDSDEMRRRCRDAGMDGYLLKPYDAAKVRRAIEEVQHNRLKTVRAAGVNGFWCDGTVPDSDLDLGAFDYYNRARPDSPEAARQLYVRAIEEQTATLDAAVAAGQTDAISMGAHRLRALSGIVRATKLNRAAMRLEELARHGPANECGAAWQSTRIACDELRQKLT